MSEANAECGVRSAESTTGEIVGRLKVLADQNQAEVQTMLARLAALEVTNRELVRERDELAAVCRDLVEESEVTLSAMRDSGSDLSELQGLIDRAQAVLGKVVVKAKGPPSYEVQLEEIDDNGDRDEL